MAFAVTGFTSGALVIFGSGGGGRAGVLGFRQEISNQGLPVISPDKIEAYAQFNTLFMYVPGLVKETMVGDVMAPFLGNVRFTLWSPP